MTLGVGACSEWLDALAARQPAPRGGAAAGLAAAIACALGAMAARYTTGKRYADQEARATALAATLDAARTAMMAWADADAIAYAKVQELRRAEADADAIAAAEAAAAAIPRHLLQRCLHEAEAIAAFIPDCNRWLRSDARAAIHLLAGAGGAAFETLCAGNPTADVRADGLGQLQRLNELAATCTAGAAD